MDPEVWLRGPLSGVPSEMMPVAHSLLQVAGELKPVVTPLSAQHVWMKPGAAASIGFHLKHLAGSLDRLLTYARGEPLSDTQLTALDDESRVDVATETGRVLFERVQAAIDGALAQVKATPVATLDDPRAVGRAHLPSTVRGLLFHAAEHAQRHSAQIITTAKILRAA